MKQDYLKCSKIGVTNLYKLNQENNIIRQIKILNTVFKLEILSRIKYNLEIYLYGSASRGEDSEESDIDLLIIGEIKRHDLIQNIEQISKKIKKKINFQIFKQSEWTLMADKDPAFYERVEKDKLRIV